MKNLLAPLGITVGVAMGVAGIVYGEADDSPGLQFMGAVLVLGTIVLGVRTARRRDRRHGRR